MLADLSDAEVLHEALVRPRDAHVAYPGIREIHRPGWSQRITPAFARGGFNSVDLAVLADADADAVIDATIAEYDALGIRFRWTVGPDSRPHDLGERLLRRGLRRHEVAVMAAPLAAITIRGTQPLAGLTVERVDLANVDRYAHTVATGWDADPVPLAAYERAVLTGRDDRHPAFLARLGGVPVGAANCALFDRSAYLMGAVVLPTFRGRGVYRALIAARLQVIAAHGLRLVTTQALRTSSAPILARLGFVTVAEIASYAR
ncbi:GNAT family N-acetyltransferase [Nannocystis sp.]|uniref:GNAT family N-acetyltransferase n=1 Tax=Nannocystis sp. TaxID=1962667 RepID=UPI002425DAC4|nr:GNAT family N-acetyltransferase [Nannocystis sp.]MBK7829936.1 GNAT family N-acetyltransferase [Nannocystis sp.]MBK9757828.1 GNAT family N-acetyltransferase [Nannocystis sp.]